MKLIAHMVYGYVGPLEKGFGFYSSSLTKHNAIAEETVVEVDRIYAAMKKSLVEKSSKDCRRSEVAELCYVQSFSFQFIN